MTLKQLWNEIREDQHLLIEVPIDAGESAGEGYKFWMDIKKACAPKDWLFGLGLEVRVQVLTIDDDCMRIICKPIKFEKRDEKQEEAFEPKRSCLWY